MTFLKTVSRTLAAIACLVLLPLSARGAEQTAIFAGGCFWCVESDFDGVKGVVGTTSGYIGGSAETANYKTVSRTETGHYEAVKIVYDDTKVSYRRLVDIFWRTVDPTDDGGQFCDRGSSYKTGIFVASDKEKAIAEASKKRAQDALGKTIVTPVVKAGPFYPAEGYHQDYYKKNPVRYKIYRYGCGRDAKIESLWGDEAMMGVAKH